MMIEYFILGGIGALAAIFLIVWSRRKKCNCDSCPGKDCPSRENHADDREKDR